MNESGLRIYYKAQETATGMVVNLLLLVKRYTLLKISLAAFLLTLVFCFPAYASEAAPTETPAPSKSAEVDATISPGPTLTSTNSIAVTPSPTLPPPAEIIGEYQDAHVVIKLAARNQYAKTVDLLRSSGLNLNVHSPINQMLKQIGYIVVEVDPGSVAQQISFIETLPNIKKAEPNYLVGINDTYPNDPHFGLQYGLTNIRAPQGWDYAVGTSNITIAVLDTGIDTNNSDFSGKLVPGYDFYNSDDNPFDDHGHGTEVSAVAAAWSNNGFGIAGVSWGARIMPVKVLSASGGGSYATVAAGIVYAANNNAHVINMSLGGSNAPSSTLLLDAVNYAASKGVILVASSGNTGGDVMYPARYDNVIAVASTDASNNWAAFSNSGPEVDLCAPGVSILTMSLSNLVIYKSGTSYSAPFVAGMAAILLELPNGGSPSQAEFLMKTTALDVGVPGNDINCGAGLIQMDQAVLAGFSPTPTPILTPTDMPEAGKTPIETPLYGAAAGTLPTFTLIATEMLSSPILTATLTPIPFSNLEQENIPTAADPSREDEVTINGGELVAATPIEMDQKIENFVAENKRLTIMTICSWSLFLLLILGVLFFNRWKAKQIKDPEQQD